MKDDSSGMFPQTFLWGNLPQPAVLILLVHPDHQPSPETIDSAPPIHSLTLFIKDVHTQGARGGGAKVLTLII